LLAPPPAQPARAPLSRSLLSRWQPGPTYRGLPRPRARAGLGLAFITAAAWPFPAARRPGLHAKAPAAAL
jgi:hypothetical protein